MKFKKKNYENFVSTWKYIHKLRVEMKRYVLTNYPSYFGLYDNGETTFRNKMSMVKSRLTPYPDRITPDNVDYLFEMWYENKELSVWFCHSEIDEVNLTKRVKKEIQKVNSGLRPLINIDRVEVFTPVTSEMARDYCWLQDQSSEFMNTLGMMLEELGSTNSKKPSWSGVIKYIKNITGFDPANDYDNNWTQFYVGGEDESDLVYYNFKENESNKEVTLSFMINDILSCDFTHPYSHIKDLLMAQHFEVCPAMIETFYESKDDELLDHTRALGIFDVQNTDGENQKSSDEKEGLDTLLNRVKKLVEKNTELELRCQDLIKENERLIGLLNEIDEIL